ncbi:MAG: T9SS type A sorting domain-containing protein [Bacteroidetes bacterium]|nr:T9SS type A sorting domain-containing protein [Bacteroidota bacterium]
MKWIAILFTLLFTISANAQNAIIKSMVETYYISDNADATDTIGGFLQSGSTTYRIYLQLNKGCKLTSIYGDANHTLKINSTEDFFNNKDRGKTFGKDMVKTNLSNNTVALDTWITLGQTSTTKNGLTYFGIPKFLDNNGSYIGGSNNDGGSAGITGGLLNNNDSSAGIPLSISDGMDTMMNLPSNWLNIGFLDAGVDSTIFGSIKLGKSFSSNISKIQNSGVSGVDPDSNYVLIAQLTTKGTISFELNVEIMNPDGSITKYAAAKSIDSLSVKHSGWLKYPYVCGCTDPDYFEYSSDYVCSNPGDCAHFVILGCMDPNACNYNPNANYNVSSLCCYPGKCDERDISLVCPNLKEDFKKMRLFPVPAIDFLTLESKNEISEEVKFAVYNSYGKIQFERNLGSVSGEIIEKLDISKLEKGIYLVRLISGNTIISNTFIKF